MLDGKRYTKNTLDQLPRSLDIMKVTTKSNENCLGFFGEICPLSNFYPSPFTFNGINYCISEQLIQHIKSKFCGDKHHERSILAAKTPLECKKLSRDIYLTSISKDGQRTLWNRARMEWRPNLHKTHEPCKPFLKPEIKN